MDGLNNLKRNKIMNALQAKQQADLYNKAENKGKLKELLDAIESASKRGEYSISTDRFLNPFVSQFLRGEGYIVKEHDNQRDYFVEIKL
jgi:hypothetical protein